MTLPFSSTLLFHTLLACSPDSEQPEVEAETSEVIEEPVAEEKDNISDQTFYMFYNAKDQSLTLDWYGDNLFKTREGPDFKGKWKIEPEIEGTLEIMSGKALRFMPKTALAPNQAYTLTIEELEHANKGILYPKNANLWSRTVTTPEFKVVGVSFGKIDRQKNTATIVVRTSHGVTLEEIKAKTSVQLNGSVIRNLTFEAKEGNQVAITLNAPSVINQSVSVDIDALTYNSAYQSTPFHWDGTLKDWETVKLFGPFVSENASGFTVEYICDDTAVSDRDWYWNYQFDFDEKISDRCTIDTEQLFNSIEIEPSVRNLKIYPRERGFALVGDFTHGNHTITIPAGVHTQDGGAITETHTNTIVVPRRSSTLRFHSLGRYMPLDGWSNLHFQHRNVDSMTLEVRRVNKQNLHHWVQDYDETVDAPEGSIVLREKIELKNTPDVMMRSNIDLQKYITKRGTGIYQVTLKDPDGSANAALTVQITDMNLITKRYKVNETNSMIATWVLNSRTNQPMSNVELSVVSTAGETTGTCKTDSAGYCAIPLPNDALNNNAFALYAERTGADGEPELAYMVFNTAEIDLGLYDATGTTGSDKTYRIAAQSDRGAYRPGDTVQLFAPG